MNLVTPLRAHKAIVADDELVARVADGKLDALGELFDRYQPDVRRLVYRLGVSAGDVDDVVQLTFLDLVKAAPRFDGRATARSWIFGIAAMVVRRHRRTLRRWMADLAGNVFESRRVAPQTPHDAFERGEEQHRFERALASLPDKKREVFVMVTMEGASGEEAAAALGVPLATVWTRLHHARLALRESLGAPS